jgi:putative spermidine/putrescine transport system substrate-binding protein
MKSVVSVIAASAVLLGLGGVAALTLGSAAALSDEMKGEGQVDIVAWPGYIERGETDKAYDWVTGFEKDTGCHVRRNGDADEPGRVRSRHGFG